MHVRPSFSCLLILMASVVLGQQTTQTKSDRDKAELRGPVKTVVEEHSFPLADGHEQLMTTTTNYEPDGRILEERTKNADGSEWVTSYTYHPDGRLLKMITDNGNSKDSSETIYLYDDERRLVGLKSGNKILTRYQYDDKGHKSATETFDSQPLSPNTAYAPFWEGTEMGFAPTPAGSVTTLYNEQGVATGAQFYDAEGNLIGHIVRKFDGEGRITAEEQAANAPQVNLLPEELRSKLNPEQMKSVGAMMAGAQNRAISYSYDAEGRVKERHMSGGVFGEQVTVTRYNDHGDKASERETTVMRSDTGPWELTEAGALIPSGKQNPPPPPSSSETQYTYQYDQYGNWTEQTIVGRSQPDEAFRPGAVVRRKLTYY